MQGVVAEHGVVEVERVLGLIERKRDLILECQESRLDNIEERNRQEITRAALRIRQKELDEEIARTLAEVEDDLRKLGVQFEREEGE